MPNRSTPQAAAPSLAIAAACLVMAAGCDEGTQSDFRVHGDFGGGDAGVSSDPSYDDRSEEVHRPDLDPFDPETACGTSAVEPELDLGEPGELLILFDRSGSMKASADGDDGASRWNLAIAAIEATLDALPDDLSVGLMLFPSPTDNACGVDAQPQVPVSPLHTSRASILSALHDAEPTGTATPIVHGTRQGWAHLDTLHGTGQRGIAMVTDGLENCASDERNALFAEAASQHDRGYLTFVVGLTTVNSFLSTLAVKGGTQRSPDCDAECGGDGDGGGSPEPTPCNSDLDCPPGEYCLVIDPHYGGVCSGGTIQAVSSISDDGDDCCHHVATASNFEQDFERALADISGLFVGGCTFDVPKQGVDRFSPDLVTVGVTFEGEERIVVPEGDDPTVTSWRFTDGDYDAVAIQGPACERLRNEPGLVEVMVACPPPTCEELDAECGTVEDDLGHVLSCGGCPEGHVCTTDNRCTFVG